MSVAGAQAIAKQIDAVYKAGIDVGYLQEDAVERHDLQQAAEMTNSRTMRVLQATAGMMVLAAGWQILSMVFPHYLFPPVPEIIARTVEVLITGSLLVGRAAHRRAHFRRTVRRLHPRQRAGAADRPLEDHGEFHHAGADLLPGHPGAVLGGVRDHLVPRHRIPRVVHHGDDHAAGLHLPDPRRLPLDVEGSVRDDDVVPAAAAGRCFGF